MTENYIRKIFVEKSRNIENFEIPLSETKRQHLIITGKNGSGKTSLLQEINKYLSRIENGDFLRFEDYKKSIQILMQRMSKLNITDNERFNLQRDITTLQTRINSFGGTQIRFSNSPEAIFEKVQTGNFILSFFDSKRHTNLNVPKGINKITLKKTYKLGEKANVDFIQYIVNLKADRSFARDDNETETVEKIDAWFDRLEDRLKSIFGVDTLELRFDRKAYNFFITTNQEQPFTFNTLSDGYSAIISIVTELLLRMEAHDVKSYDLEGIVIIDEIETHLHVDLQKKILPFLVDFFPRIQFIVSTHSPFVLSSLSNAMICDLETKIVTSDLSGYSYDALIESYFRTDKYSEEVKQKINEFEELTSLTERTEEQNDRLRHLRNYFAHAPKYLSTELLVKLQQIELNELNRKNSN